MCQTTTPRQRQVKSAKAAELTFGIEIECFLPRGSVRVGGYHRGARLGGDFPAGWNAQSDSSLHTTLRNYQAVEIVSPILKGADGLAQVRQVAAILKRMTSLTKPGIRSISTGIGPGSAISGAGAISPPHKSMV